MSQQLCTRGPDVQGESWTIFRNVNSDLYWVVPIVIGPAHAGWFYYPDPDWNIPLCADHKSAVLAMPCDRWLNDSGFEPKKGGVDRSRTCGAPAVGLISWDCEGGHDEECDQIGCPGYELMPACARCLENPNDNDVDHRDRQ